MFQGSAVHTNYEKLGAKGAMVNLLCIRLKYNINECSDTVIRKEVFTTCFMFSVMECAEITG